MSFRPTSRSQQQQQAPIKLTKPVFKKVNQLEPESKGHNLHVKVVELRTVLEKTKFDGSKITIGEALVGDATGCVLVTVRNEQIGVCQTGKSVTIRNAKVEMYKGHMRLVVDIWGLIEPSDSELNEQPLTTNNLSSIEYELVDA